MATSTDQKSKNKVFRSILQLVVLLVVGYVLVQSIWMLNKYEDKNVSADSFNNTEGFVSISYTGVDRNGSIKYISKKDLEKHLKALHAQGFDTISQQQILNFYEKNEALPDKALFLSFEDGRKDSVIFTQPVLEELNLKATMFQYADRLPVSDTKFLKPRHLEQMLRSKYWEVGSNGYRLAYINAFNKQGEYIGEFDETEVEDFSNIEYYNHYLMDYRRDHFMEPKETKTQMTKRITKDYDLLYDTYMEHLGEIPRAYAIMHANSLYNNMDKDVEAVNDENIKKHFYMHFNRDVTSFNSKKEHQLDLNRLQVEPHWPVNHLLMKIQQDTGMAMSFVKGDESIAKLWEMESGVGEFEEQRINLTTAPFQHTIARYGKELPRSFQTSWNWAGQVAGEQWVEVISETGDSLQVTLRENRLLVKGVSPDGEESTEEIDLGELEWEGKNYAFRKATVYDYEDTQKEVAAERYPLTLAHDKMVELSVENDELILVMDEEEVLRTPLKGENYTLKFGARGILTQQQEGQVNDAELIYDTVLQDLKIVSGDENLYVQRTQFERFMSKVNDGFSDVVDIFINTF